MNAKHGRPRVRTQTVRSALASFSAKHGDRLGDLIAEIPPGVMLAIQGRDDWVDVDDDRYVPEAITTVLGEEGALEFFSELAQEQIEGALFRPFVALVRSRFGRGPYALLRMVPVGWKVVYRDVCLIFVRRDAPMEATVSFRGLPPEVVTSQGYLTSFTGFLLGLVVAGGMQPEYETSLDPEEGLFEVRLSWREPDAASRRS